MFGMFLKSVYSAEYRGIKHQIGQNVINSSRSTRSPDPIMFQKNYYSTIRQQITSPKKYNEPQQQNKMPKNFSAHVLKDLLFQECLKPFNIGKNSQQNEKDNLANLTSQKKVQIQTIDSLQFEANSPIQDKLVCKCLQSIQALCLSIFDGHGGNILSQYASKKLCPFIDDYIKSHLTQQHSKDNQLMISLIKQSIQYAYQQIEQQFYQVLENQFKTGNKDILKIGSCAITAVIYGDAIIIANCGDSQSIIVTENHEGLDFIVGNQLLNVDNPDEKKRIQKEFQGIDEKVFVQSKTNRKTYLKGFLQPTRTLGDYYLKKQKYFSRVSTDTFKGPYIKYNPQFNVIPIKSNFRHLIIASDGLWDFVSKTQVLKVVKDQKEESIILERDFSTVDLGKAYIETHLQQQTKKLTQKLKNYVLQKCAKKKKKTLEDFLKIPSGQRRNYCDDISIIAVSFKEKY